MIYTLPTYDKRCEYRERLLRDYADIEVGLLGRSILSRDIDCFKIGRGRSAVLVCGAHHGMEYITTLALFDFMEFVEEKSARLASYCGVDANFLLQKFTFWVIPCLNPDGVELCLSGLGKSPLSERLLKMNGSSDFSRWQANARGVDLNHNYDFGFAEYKRYEESHGISAGRSAYSGEYPESEPEVKSLLNLVRTVRPALSVSLHTQGEEIYSMPKTPYMERLSQKISREICYDYLQPCGTAAYGGLTDYLGAMLGIPSFTVELGRGENPLPLSQLESICAVVRKLLFLLPTLL